MGQYNHEKIEFFITKLNFFTFSVQFLCKKNVVKMYLSEAFLVFRSCLRMSQFDFLQEFFTKNDLIKEALFNGKIEFLF